MKVVLLCEEMHQESGAGAPEPTLGKDAELQALAASDLDVEALMAGGADIDDLIAAGVIEDDDQATNFVGVPAEALKFVPGPPMSADEFEASMADIRWLTKGSYLIDAPN